MNSLKKYLGAPAIIAVATFALICGSNLLSLGAFGVTSVLGMAGLLLALTVAVYPLFCLTAAAVCMPFSMQQPGMLLQTLFGVLSGTFAIWLVALVLPGTVLLSGLLAAVPYAAVNTAMIWLLAAVTGSLRQGLTILPKRK